MSTSAKDLRETLTAEELSQAVLEGTAPTAPTAPKGGIKYDSGKPIAAVLYQDFPQALSAVVDVATFGAKKYARSSWRTVPDAAQRYADAMHRHMLAHARGERLDPDSGLPHCAHIAWNALALAELELCTGMGADKLSATGPAAGSADGASSTHCAPKPEFVFGREAGGCGRVVDGNCLSTKSVTVTIGGGAGSVGGAGGVGGSAKYAVGGAGTGSTAVFSSAVLVSGTDNAANGTGKPATAFDTSVQCTTTAKAEQLYTALYEMLGEIAVYAGLPDFARYVACDATCSIFAYAERPVFDAGCNGWRLQKSIDGRQYEASDVLLIARARKAVTVEMSYNSLIEINRTEQPEN